MKRSSPTLIGAFVLGGAALVLAAVLIWGSGWLFRPSWRYVCYFAGSVNGLAIGAPVKFRGVEIGAVREIRLRYAQQADDRRIPVFIDLDERRVEELGAGLTPSPDMIANLIDQGLRARLETLSIVTGVLYVNFDFYPDVPVQMTQSDESEFLEIPTVPTPLEEAAQTASEILMHLQEADVAGLTLRLTELVQSMNEVARSPALRAAIDELPATLESVHQLTTSLNARSEKVAANAEELAVETRRALVSLQATLDAIQGLVAPDAPLPVQLGETVTELGRAARALRGLADYLERNPNAVVFGRPEPAQ
jgi:paraquat-inducible protein B